MSEKSSFSESGLLALLRSRPREVPATTVLVLTIVCIFAFVLADGARMHQSRDALQLAWGANFGPATAAGEWWRLGSALFVHFGLVHVALNAWALWDCGRLVERLFGALRFLGVFLGAGIVGNLASLAAHGNDAVSAGASGAIFGLYGALMAHLWRERGALQPFEFRWLFGGAALFSTAAIVLGFFIPGIDNAAHGGGLVAGALLGTLARPGRLGLRDLNLRLGALATLALGIAVTFASIPAPSYRWKDELQARDHLRRFAMGERTLNERLRTIISQRGSASFDELADRIESEVEQPYQESFESLSKLQLPAEAPTAIPLDIARRYAGLRTEASQLLVEGLRAHDPERIRDALDLARQAPYLAHDQAPLDRAP